MIAVLTFIFYFLANSVLWGLGYMQTSIWKQNNDIDENFVRVPKWFYILCGMPQAKNLPKRVLTTDGFALQLITLVVMLYQLQTIVLGVKYNSNHDLRTGACYVLGFILAAILQRRWGYILDVIDDHE